MRRRDSKAKYRTCLSTVSVEEWYLHAESNFLYPYNFAAVVDALNSLLFAMCMHNNNLRRAAALQPSPTLLTHRDVPDAQTAVRTEAATPDLLSSTTLYVAKSGLEVSLCICAYNDSGVAQT